VGDVSTWTWGGVGSTGSWMAGANGYFAPQRLLFDLGAPCDLQGINIWNFTLDASPSYYGGWGVKDFRVYSSNVDGDLLTQIGSGTLDKVTSVPSWTQQYVLSGATGVQYVALLADNGWGAPPPEVGCYLRIGRVNFSAVPEPGTLVLLGAGLFGLLCYAWRKRK
jgi:hypothetical protein